MSCSEDVSGSVLRSKIISLEARLTGPMTPFTLTTAGEFPCKVYERGPRTLLDIYRKALSLGDICLLTTNGQSFSYKYILDAAARLALFLGRTISVPAGSRIAIALPNGPEALIAFIASTLSGAVPVLMEVGENSRIRQNCERVGCILLIRESNDHFKPISLERREKKVVFKKLDDGLEFQWPDADEIPACPFPEVSLASHCDDAIVAMTSGTTGHSKGVVHTHLGVITGLLNTMLAANLANPLRDTANKPPLTARRPRTLLLAPFAHVSGYTQLLLLMMMGGTLVLTRDLFGDAVSALIEKEGITSISGLTPALAQEILNRSGRFDLQSLSFIHVNGFALHQNLANDINSVLPNVTVGTSYGMTETNGAICALSGESLRQRPRSCGRVLPTVEIEIRDNCGRPLDVDQVGQIWLKGAMLLREYCGTESDTLKDGWLNTGDLGQLSEDRFLSISDRMRDTISIDGQIFGYSEIEHAVSEIPGVSEVAAFDISSPQGTSLMVAYVSKVGISIQETVVCEFIRKMFRVESFARSIAVLPRNASGKIDRTQLRKIVQTEPGRRHSDVIT